jgi:hypothetical protein
MSITASAVLCEMNISVWTANKLDKGETLPYRNQVTFVFRLGNRICKTYEISTKRISMTA